MEYGWWGIWDRVLQEFYLFIYKNCKWIVKMWRALFRIDEETGWRNGWREVVIEGWKIGGIKNILFY